MKVSKQLLVTSVKFEAEKKQLRMKRKKIGTRLNEREGVEEKQVKAEPLHLSGERRRVPQEGEAQP